MKDRQIDVTENQIALSQPKAIKKPVGCGAWIDIQFEVSAFASHSGALVRGMAGCNECPLLPSQRVSGVDLRSVDAAENRLYRQVEDQITQRCPRMRTNPPLSLL